jgi:hypothetical protein
MLNPVINCNFDFPLNQGVIMEVKNSVLTHRILFILKNKNGMDISCQSEIIATKEQALEYFSKAVEGLSIEIVDVSDESQWESEHTH